jgi:DNA-binding NtrC family response regulator
VNKPPAGEKYRILVIDDNHAIHDDFRKIFSPASAATEALEATEAALFGTPADAAPLPSSRFEMDSADQGQEGRRRVEKALEEGRPYALAFVDMRMPPGWDGMETTRKIWEIDPAVQIIICTAYSDYSWSEMLAKIGDCTGLVVLKKPFDTIEVLQLAHVLAEKWRLRRQFLQEADVWERKLAERTRELEQARRELREAEAAARGELRAKAD